MQTGRISAGRGPAYWVVGDRYEFKATGDQTGGAFALFDAWISPGHGPPPHRHSREDEAFYILDGEVWFEVDGQEFTAGPGDWITLAIGSLHRFQNRSNRDARMLILVRPAGLDRFFAEVGRPVNSGDAGTVGPKDIERLMEAAPRYGLEIHPPGG